MTAGEVAEADDEVVVPLSATTTDPIGAPTMASLAFLLIVPRAFRVAALFPTEEELARAQRRAQGRRLQDDASQDAVAHRWTECLAKLDEARALDPELDEDPEVKDLRAAAAKALAGDGDAGKAGDARQ